jgi:hypothetical protein
MSLLMVMLLSMLRNDYASVFMGFTEEICIHCLVNDAIESFVQEHEYIYI